MLNKYGLTKEEVTAILYHEIGHTISKKQEKLLGIECEFDADEYAISKIGKESLISALEKTKIIIKEESNKKPNLEDIENRIKNANKYKDEKLR